MSLYTHVYVSLIFFLFLLASDDLRQAETLANSYPNTSATSLNVQTEEDKLKSLIKGHDLVMR